ncbi:MAG: alpha-hydroxy acid oxidase [Pseudomonadota bacterium]
MAQRRLPNFMYEYLEGGADQELTLRRNQAILNECLLQPRMAVDATKTDTSTSLFGAPLRMPVVIAPTGFNGMLWRHGDLEIARAAAGENIPAAQSTVSMSTIEDVSAVKGLRHWFQLYAYGGLPMAERLLERALAAGSEALVITIDGAVAGNRLWDQRNYVSRGKLNLRSKLDILRHPHWLRNVLLKDGPPNFVNLYEFVSQKNPDVFTMGRWVAGNRPVLSWDDIRRLRQLWPRKLVIKGILRVDEANTAASLGADAIILSNHGGRQAEPAISPVEVIAELRRSLGPAFTIMVDSGFRTGTQLAVALALGANAVMVGRAVLYGLAAAGQPGVAKALGILESEFRRTLALLGVHSVAELSPDLISRCHGSVHHS